MSRTKKQRKQAQQPSDSHTIKMTHFAITPAIVPPLPWSHHGDSVIDEEDEVDEALYDRLQQSHQSNSSRASTFAPPHRSHFGLDGVDADGESNPDEDMFKPHRRVNFVSNQ